MERLYLTIFATVSLLAVWVANHPVEGKCKGSWSNHHACFGANGKRAFPSESTRRSLLLRNLAPKRDVISDNNDAYLSSAGIDDRTAPYDQERVNVVPDYYPDTNRDAEYAEKAELANFIEEMLRRLKSKNANK